MHCEKILFQKGLADNECYLPPLDWSIYHMKKKIYHVRQTAKHLNAIYRS